MRIQILGAGWYGCHLATALLADGHDVRVYERGRQIFSGASGGNPARLHIGPHYPRSAETRQACRDHAAKFAAAYGHLTRGVPLNLYAVASYDSLLDFATYCKVLRGEMDFLPVDEPALYGLQDVEGAILCGERHIVIREAREHFRKALLGRVVLTCSPEPSSAGFDLVIDCTFCARDGAGIARYEPCITVLLSGPTNRAITIMDGPFPSLYPWDEAQGLSSLTSASLTPFSKSCASWAEAQGLLDKLTKQDIEARGRAMLDQMAQFYPRVRDLYRVADYKLSTRAQPRSAADARLCDVIAFDARTLRVRAGKIDAIFHAERKVKEYIACLQSGARKAA